MRILADSIGIIALVEVVLRGQPAAFKADRVAKGTRIRGLHRVRLIIFLVEVVGRGGNNLVTVSLIVECRIITDGSSRGRR